MEKDEASVERKGEVSYLLRVFLISFGQGEAHLIPWVLSYFEKDPRKQLCSSKKHLQPCDSDLLLYKPSFPSSVLLLLKLVTDHFNKELIHLSWSLIFFHVDICSS